MKKKNGKRGRNWFEVFFSGFHFTFSVIAGKFLLLMRQCACLFWMEISIFFFNFLIFKFFYKALRFYKLSVGISQVIYLFYSGFLKKIIHLTTKIFIFFAFFSTSFEQIQPSFELNSFEWRKIKLEIRIICFLNWIKKVYSGKEKNI